MNKRFYWVMWAAISLVCSPSVWAQQNRNDAALTKLQQMVRQANTERDALKAQVANIQKQLESEKAKSAAAQNQLKGAKKELGDTDTLLGKYKTTDAALRERIEQQRGKMQEVVDKYKELVVTLRQLEAERNQFRGDLTAKIAQFDTCAEKNRQLYQAGMEITERYEKKGVWQSLMAAEPVTQLKRVELEGLVQEYANRLDQSRVKTAESP